MRLLLAFIAALVLTATGAVAQQVGQTGLFTPGIPFSGGAPVTGAINWAQTVIKSGGDPSALAQSSIYFNTTLTGTPSGGSSGQFPNFGSDALSAINGFAVTVNAQNQMNTTTIGGPQSENGALGVFNTMTSAQIGGTKTIVGYLNGVSTADFMPAYLCPTPGGVQTCPNRFYVGISDYVVGADESGDYPDTTATCNTTLGSFVLASCVLTSQADFHKGEMITGAGISAGAAVVSLPTGSSVLMTRMANATGTGVTLGFHKTKGQWQSYGANLKIPSAAQYVLQVKTAESDVFNGSFTTKSRAGYDVVLGAGMDFAAPEGDAGFIAGQADPTFSLDCSGTQGSTTVTCLQPIPENGNTPDLTTHQNPVTTDGIATGTYFLSYDSNPNQFELSAPIEVSFPQTGTTQPLGIGPQGFTSLLQDGLALGNPGVGDGAKTGCLVCVQLNGQLSPGTFTNYQPRIMWGMNTTNLTFFNGGGPLDLTGFTVDGLGNTVANSLVLATSFTGPSTNYSGAFWGLTSPVVTFPALTMTDTTSSGALATAETGISFRPITFDAMNVVTGTFAGVTFAMPLAGPSGNVSGVSLYSARFGGPIITGTAGGVSLFQDGATFAGGNFNASGGTIELGQSSTFATGLNDSGATGAVNIGNSQNTVNISGYNVTGPVVGIVNIAAGALSLNHLPTGTAAHNLCVTSANLVITC